MDGFNLVGRIRPVYKGSWNAETAYAVLETVITEANNAAYIAIKDVPSGTPLTNAEYWGVLIDASDIHTPVKGTDYWTEEDRLQIINDVLAALPAAEEATF